MAACLIYKADRCKQGLDVFYVGWQGQPFVLAVSSER